MISKEERKRIIQQMRFNSSMILRLLTMNAVHKMQLGIPPFDDKATRTSRKSRRVKEISIAGCQDCGELEN